MQTPAPDPGWIEIFADFITRNKLGDVINVAGLILALIGFGITIWQIRRSIAASQAAKDASENTQREINKIDTIIEFSTAIALMEEIKRHHRTGYLHILPDRYATLRKRLVSIKSNNSYLEAAQLTRIQEAVQHFKNMEDSVEKGLHRKTYALNVAKFNGIVSDQIDFMNELLVEIKTTTEGKLNGRLKN